MRDAWHGSNRSMCTAVTLVGTARSSSTFSKSALVVLHYRRRPDELRTVLWSRIAAPPHLISRQSTGLCPRRRMISLSMGSCTVSAACLIESHLTSRSSFSGHCLL